MIPEHPAFDYLDFTFSDFGTPTIDSSSIRLPVRELWVHKGFPNHEEGKFYKEATLVFENVVTSTHKISDNSTGFWKEEYFTDGPFVPYDGEVFYFELQGHFYNRPNPYATLSFYWEIVAASFSLNPPSS
jgi:hypothetical protein